MPQSPASKSLVIFLHGVGSRGADLAPLGSHWRTLLPNATFAAPDAPESFDQGDSGRQWFSIAGVTEANRAARIEAARTAFDRMIGDLITEAGLSGALDRVAFVGFSQGSIMALDALASGRWPIGAIVAFSGRLATLPPFAPPATTTTLLIHGAVDPVIPASESIKAEAALSSAGFKITRHELPGVAHTISGEGAAIAGRFLRGALAG
jgi:phospholipase/carboxylesterase